MGWYSLLRYEQKSSHRPLQETVEGAEQVEERHHHHANTEKQVKIEGTAQIFLSKGEASREELNSLTINHQAKAGSEDEERIEEPHRCEMSDPIKGYWLASDTYHNSPASAEC